MELLFYHWNLSSDNRTKLAVSTQKLNRLDPKLVSLKKTSRRFFNQILFFFQLTTINQKSRNKTQTTEPTWLVCTRSKSLLNKPWNEWGWTAWIAIARHAIARHFLLKNNFSTQKLKTARIGLTVYEQMTKKFTTAQHCRAVVTQFLHQ